MDIVSNGVDLSLLFIGMDMNGGFMFMFMFNDLNVVVNMVFGNLMMLFMMGMYVGNMDLIG